MEIIMGLQIIAGSSGVGKSTLAYQTVIDKSIQNPDRNYIIVVPEQYTMATQKKFVYMHPNKGILNIDIVSFERLAFKVFEETGGQNRPVLDDTGKNLIVRKVLEEHKKKLRYFGSSVNKTGFVSELKSVISELLQYGISIEYMSEIVEKSANNNLLTAKLQDINLIYGAFMDYLTDNYITKEEILDVLCQVIDKSSVIKKSEILFDGFTGFTPIQYNLIMLLLQLCSQITVTVTIDAKEKLNVYEGIHNLFFMSKEMIQKLYKLCDERHIEINEPIIMNQEVNPRFNSQRISFLEKNLFRYKGAVYRGDDDNAINLYEAAAPKEEVQFAVSEILKLTRFCGYRYKDIAIVSGDIGLYGLLAGNICKQNNIPVFVDNKKAVADNPLVEFIRGALEVIEKNYSYETMLRYLRTGMTGITREDVDLIDNYCVATGIHGTMWHKKWTRKGRQREGFPLEVLNELRIQIMAPLRKLEKNLNKKGVTVKDFVTSLYEFLVDTKAQEKINAFAEMPDTGDEYYQIYEKIIELFDKLVELLGMQRLTLGEFNKIIDSGIAEIKVGLIPPTADCVVVGDIERTRLEDIKVLFFLGVNEGIIPKKNDNKGILSEADRDYLEEMQVELSDSSRRKSFVQKFYLYLILTKPSDRIYITFSTKGTDGKGTLPSYLVRSVRQMFPDLPVTTSKEVNDQLHYIRIPKSELVYRQDSFIKLLGESLALALYNERLTGSISAFEQFAACHFAYFLCHGLGLHKRDEYGFEGSDFGTIMHSVIENVCRKAQNRGEKIQELTDEARLAYIKEALATISDEYSDTILKDSGRNRYILKRMTKLADRTLWAVGKQMESGKFVPDAFEFPFLMDEQVIALKKGSGRMCITGKIDRIDICEDDENVYVRVIDYKTGNSDFNLTQVYYGLKMQLITYLRAALQMEAKRHPKKNIIPAGVFYYNVKDPLIAFENQDADQLNLDILQELMLKGAINREYDLPKMMDASYNDKSIIIPVTFDKDGRVKEKDNVFSTEAFDKLQRYVAESQTEIGKQILAGNNEITPFKDGTYTSCDYCPYSEVCGFSPSLGGKGFRRLEKMDSEEIWSRIDEKLNGTSSAHEIKENELENESGVSEDGKSVD